MVPSDIGLRPVTQVVGPRKIVETAHALGIHSKLPAYFAIGLGSVTMNPLDMTHAYTTIANDGKQVDERSQADLPRVLDSVVDPAEWQSTPQLARRPRRPPAAEAGTLTSILERVRTGRGREPDPGARDPQQDRHDDDYGDA